MVALCQWLVQPCQVNSCSLHQIAKHLQQQNKVEATFETYFMKRIEYCGKGSKCWLPALYCLLSLTSYVKAVRAALPRWSKT